MKKPKPGRELDAMIAVEVMGWDYYKSKHGHFIVTDGDGNRREPGFAEMPPKFNPNTGKKNRELEWWEVDSEIPDYSTSIADAWLIVELLGRMLDARELTLECEAGGWYAQFGYSRASDWVETAPHAICLAALKCMEGK